MDAKNDHGLYDMLTAACLNWLKANDRADVLNLLNNLMDMPEVPMHSPVHHFLIPAALLTTCRKMLNQNPEILADELAIARDRSLQVPGGMCGYLGCCGAAVGVGIFWSVITGATPMSETQWSHGLRGTGDALLAMAEVGGPRCCKRCSYIAISTAAPQIEEVLGLKQESATTICRHYIHNNECIKTRCSFYPLNPAELIDDQTAATPLITSEPASEPMLPQGLAGSLTKPIPIMVPDFCFPKKDVDNYCPCQDIPVTLTGKKGRIFWLKDEGDLIKRGDHIAELEVDMKTVMLPSPAEGILVSKSLLDEDNFSFGHILGYLEAIHD